MTLLRTLRFTANAVAHRHAYIDLDGCLLRKFPVPKGVKDPLTWWTVNLSPTRIVKRRLVLCYLLKLFGVALHIWTNRSPQHEGVTCIALGPHKWLFDSAHYMSGEKASMPRVGPCIDDEIKYTDTRFNDLHVPPK